MLIKSGSKGIVRVQHNTGTVGAANMGTSVTTSGTSSVKGTPAELISSTSFDSYWMVIMASEYGTATTACEGSMDILIGAATESVLIADLLMGHCGGGAASVTEGQFWAFPLYIPAGSRIAAQAAGVRLSTAMRVAVWLYGGNGYPPFKVGTRVTTYGMGTVPNGTTITPGTSGSEGAWAQITASTSEAHFALVPSFQHSADTSLVNKAIYVDMGLGAATEEEVAQSYVYIIEAQERIGNPFNFMPAFVDVPASTRLVMRAGNSTSNDNAGTYNGVIHAVS